MTSPVGSHQDSTTNQPASDKGTNFGKWVYVKQSDVTPPAQDLIHRSYTLDASSVNDEKTFSDVSNYSHFTIKVVLASGTSGETVAVQGDLTSDQSGGYTADLGIKSRVDMSTVTLTMVDGVTYVLEDCDFSLLKFYVKAANTGTFTLTVTARGHV